MKIFKLIVIGPMVFMSLTTRSQTIQDGIQALENEQFNKASGIFYSILRNNAAGPDCYYYLGETLRQGGKTDSARLLFNKGITLFPANPFNYVGLGNLLLNANNQMESRINFEKALALSPPKESRTCVMEAEAYINSKNSDIPKAYELLNKALSLEPKNPSIYVALGDAFLSDNNGGMAVTNYEKSIELRPKWAKPHAKIGLVYTRSRNFEGSEKAFNEAIALEPEYTPAYRDLAELYYAFRRYEKARDTYELYLQKADTTVQSLTKYAYILFMSKDYAKQIAVIDQLMAIDSTNIILNRLQAYSLYEQKKYQEGLNNMENFFRKADKTKIIPQDYEYYGKLLGKAPRDTVSKANRDSLAIVNLKKAMELDSTKIELYTDMGEVYMRAKNYSSAQHAFQKKIDADPTPSAIDFFSLGKSYYFNKEFEKSDSAFLQVIALKPAASAGYLWRARSNGLNEKANIDSTFSMFNKYLEIAIPDPKSPKQEIAEAYRFLGYYYIQKENNEKARENYSKSLEYDPENKDAREILLQLTKQK